MVPHAVPAALACALALLSALASSAIAQGVSATPSTARITVTVLHDAAPIEAAMVRAATTVAQTDASGRATLRLPSGRQTIIAARIGFRPDSVNLTLRVGVDTAIAIELAERAAEVTAVVVAAARSERRVEDVPLRVEVIDEEEISEKVSMTPGDIAMMLNETSGLRVQTTSPSLGGANVRIQGLLGRYSLLLADGLPLYGGQVGGLGLLQIPPLDLARVEVIKGSASALYGSSALGGVVNLISRQPGATAEHVALVNQTSRDASDAVGFLAGPMNARWGYTLLGGAHRQARRDLDDDGWTDLPGYERFVIRPRLHYADRKGGTAFVTAGLTNEDRRGGTLAGRAAPDGLPWVERLDTRRTDVGGLARWVITDSARALHGAIVTLRGSAASQHRGHTIGPVREGDRHQTWFGEVALAVPRGGVTMVGGAALQRDRFRAADVAGFDFDFTVSSAFAQVDVDPSSWLALSASARLDAHSEYGASVNPRISALLRRPTAGAFAGWTSRLSVGSGEYAPTPFTDETEATGLTPLRPLANLAAERATTASVDVGGPVEMSHGQLEFNATAFASRVRQPVQAVDADGTTATGARRMQLVNAPEPTRTWGGELLMRVSRELGDASSSGEEPPTLRLTATYTYLRSTECDPAASAPYTLGACARREVSLTPRHAAGVVAAIEHEGTSRLGIEVYYTGRQNLEENPYRNSSKPYVMLGLLGERAFTTRAGTLRAFVNLENITNVRQTRWDPLLLPVRGQGGRWTTDAWTDLVGFTVNAGVRLAF